MQVSGYSTAFSRDHWLFQTWQLSLLESARITCQPVAVVVVVIIIETLPSVYF